MESCPNSGRIVFLETKAPTGLALYGAILVWKFFPKIVIYYSHICNKVTNYSHNYSYT
jgi:hypothetical protein